jgi:phage-related protein
MAEGRISLISNIIAWRGKNFKTFFCRAYQIVNWMRRVANLIRQITNLSSKIAGFVDQIGNYYSQIVNLMRRVINFICQIVNLASQIVNFRRRSWQNLTDDALSLSKCLSAFLLVRRACGDIFP